MELAAAFWRAHSDPGLGRLQPRIEVGIVLGGWFRVFAAAILLCAGGVFNLGHLLEHVGALFCLRSGALGFRASSSSTMNFLGVVFAAG